MNEYQKNLYSYAERRGVKLEIPAIEPKLLALFFAVATYRSNFDKETYNGCWTKLSSFDRKCLAEFTKDLSPFDLIEALEAVKELSVKTACFEVLKYLKAIPESKDFWQNQTFRLFEKTVDTDHNYYSTQLSHYEDKHYFCGAMDSFEEFSKVIVEDLKLESCVIVFYGTFPKVSDKDFETFNKWLKKARYKILFIRELNYLAPNNLSNIEGISSGSIIRTDSKNILVIHEGYKGPKLFEKDVDVVAGNIKMKKVEEISPFINYVTSEADFVYNLGNTIVKGLGFNQIGAV
jgi:hypothetical protein